MKNLKSIEIEFNRKTEKATLNDEREQHTVRENYILNKSFPSFTFEMMIIIIKVDRERFCVCE